MCSSTEKCYAHLFCSPLFPVIFIFDAEKHAVDCAVARSIDAVSKLPYVIPLFIRDNSYLQRAQWTKEEVEMVKIKTTVLKSHLKVANVHPSSFPVRIVRSLVRSWQLLAYSSLQ
jgi:hypothetical protein